MLEANLNVYHENNNINKGRIDRKGQGADRTHQKSRAHTATAMDPEIFKNRDMGSRLLFAHFGPYFA